MNTTDTPDSPAADLPDLSRLTVAVIGAGNMGGPVVTSMLAAGVPGERLRIANSTPASSERAAQQLGATAAASREEGVQGADVVVLGVKPYQVTGVLTELREHLGADTLVLSLAAAVTLEQMAGVLPEAQPIARAMPNTPISVGEGAVGLMSTGLTTAQHDLLHALFSRAGVVVDITEDQVHAFIGAAGSLSALVFALIEAMTDEAVREGLKRDLASQLVQQTVRGAATMLIESGTHAAVAKNGVSSPGGTTVEALAEFERQGVRGGIASAMAASMERSRELTGD
ncbi:pyrroline-5-carboxylate reductase [Brachybacterium sp. Marseille-Q7125]|uniref:pyrroline-5-carboxylate reductase n=1 Tax=Brachybacterium sp. Marseille-Q7125 TaxID=2932815 RepID=UPI001FF1423A|nr:pyrroline-5-carboxylate reductase [Brachybacterium sp. Marseille-Q7125]